MKKRNSLIIASVLVLGVLALIVVLSRGQSSTIKQNYHVQDIASVSKIFMADKLDNQVTLTRDKGDTTWTVNGEYEASLPMIELFLETLNEMRLREQVNKTAAPNVAKQLASKSVKTEIYQRVYRIDWFKHKLRLFPHEKKTSTLFIGHETQDMFGTYCYREGDKVPVILYKPGLRGFIAPRFIADPLVWRSHRIVSLKVQEIERVELEIPAAPEESFAILRKGNGFEMEMLQTHQKVNGFDTARVAQLLSSFTNLNFDEYSQLVPKNERDTTFSKAPRTILRVKDTKGNQCELKTYIKYNNPDDIINMPDPEMYKIFDLDRLYAVLDAKDTVLIQYYVFDNILQPASFYLGQQKSSFAKQ